MLRQLQHFAQRTFRLGALQLLQSGHARPDARMGNGLQKRPARPACTVDAAVFVKPGLRILLGEPVCIVALQHDLAHLLQRPAVSGIGLLPPKLHDVGCHPAERVLTLDNGQQQLRRAAVQFPYATGKIGQPRLVAGQRGSVQVQGQLVHIGQERIQNTVDQRLVFG